MKKFIVGILATLMLCGCIVGTSIAWLTDETDPIVTTFTAGDIEITLTQATISEDSLIMVPGNKINVTPVATVLANSEDCYLFVFVEEVNNFDTYMTYAMADGWTALDGVDGVYYREVVKNKTEDQPFPVISDNTITVRTTLDADTLETAEQSNPALRLTAFAVQKANIATVQDAWAVFIPVTP